MNRHEVLNLKVLNLELQKTSRFSTLNRHEVLYLEVLKLEVQTTLPARLVSPYSPLGVSPLGIVSRSKRAGTARAPVAYSPPPCMLQLGKLLLTTHHVEYCLLPGAWQ